jgi:hypothetical protein
LGSRSFGLLSKIALVVVGIGFLFTTVVWYQHKNEKNFTDRIQMGEYNVAFYAADAINDDHNDLDGNIWDLKTEQDSIFRLPENIAPGDTFTRYIKVINTGEEDINYFTEFSIKETSILENALVFHIAKYVPDAESDYMVLANTIEDIRIWGNKLNPSSYELFEITVTFSNSAGNQYNMESPDLAFEFDFFLYAWAYIDNQINDLDVLLDKINLTDDWMRLSYILPSIYLDQLVDSNQTYIDALSHDVLQDVFNNRPVNGYQTIAQFETIFTHSLTIHTTFMERLVSIQESTETIDIAMFEELIIVLEKNPISVIRTKSGNKDRELLIDELEDIVIYIGEGHIETIKNIIDQQKPFIDLIEMIDEITNGINSA